MKLKIMPNTHEIVLNAEDFIVSKTDLKGRITYANRAFMRIANFPEHMLLGEQHNVIRHPDMPRGVFRLLWKTLEEGREFFGYVKNITSDGSFYWVFANVTRDMDYHGNVAGYFSVRRKPTPEAIAVIQELYRDMAVVESRVGAGEAPLASCNYLLSKFEKMGTTYDKYVLALQRQSA